VSEHHALANARWVIEQEELERRLRDPERHALRRFWRAVVIARDVEALEALLDGERVPLDRLDSAALARFGVVGEGAP
jgi:hypothetical protein